MGVLAKLGYGIAFLGCADVDQGVRVFDKSVSIGFGSADIHVAVDECGVNADDAERKMFGKG